VHVEDSGNEKNNTHQILEALTEMLRAETPLHEMEEEEIGFELYKCELWCSLPLHDELNLWNSYSVLRNLDLEIRYDENSNKWHACLLSRYSTKDSYFTYSSLQESLPGVLIISTCYDADKVFAAKKIGPQKYRIFSIDGANYIGSHSQYMGFDLGVQEEFKSSWSAGKFRGIDDVDGVHAFDERYFRMLLQTDSEDLKNCYFKPLIDSWKDVKEMERSFFVKAPKRSLSYYILTNLAYAPKDERIDQLLINDAKKKYSMLKEYSLLATKEYEEAISKF
jgi:hypothetical protein